MSESSLSLAISLEIDNSDSFFFGGVFPPPSEWSKLLSSHSLLSYIGKLMYWASNHFLSCWNLIHRRENYIEEKGTILKTYFQFLWRYCIFFSNYFLERNSKIETFCVNIDKNCIDEKIDYSLYVKWLSGLPIGFVTPGTRVRFLTSGIFSVWKYNFLSLSLLIWFSLNQYSYLKICFDFRNFRVFLKYI